MMMKSGAAGVFLWAACAAGLPGAEAVRPVAVGADAAEAGHGGRLVVEEVRREAAAGDLRGLMAALPGLEPLWQEDPAAYLEALKTGVHALIASGDAEAVRAALATFPRLAEKRSPADPDAALAYVTVKWLTISEYLSAGQLQPSRENVLKAADFLGEVRSMRIPGYRNQGTNRPGLEILVRAGVREVKDLPTAELREAMAQAVKKNEENFKRDDLQSRLFSVDSGLFAGLKAYVQRNFPPGRAENQVFYQEFARRGALTAEEAREVQVSGSF